MNIAIFYHCLFYLGTPPELSWSAMEIVCEQMGELEKSGLAAEASEIVAGVNGGSESLDMGRMLIPLKAKLVMHGLESKAENPTIVCLHQWCKENPDWHVLYFHAKGVSHPPGDWYGDNVSRPWRHMMMEDLVTNWRGCVRSLSAGYDVVCSRWLWNMLDGSQNIPAGNFLWTTSNFVAKLPSMFERARIKMSGISHIDSRHEAEVFWGNGPRPNVLSIRPTYWRPWAQSVNRRYPVSV